MANQNFCLKVIMVTSSKITFMLSMLKETIIDTLFNGLDQDFQVMKLLNIENILPSLQTTNTFQVRFLVYLLCRAMRMILSLLSSLMVLLLTMVLMYQLPRELNILKNVELCSRSKDHLEKNLKLFNKTKLLPVLLTVMKPFSFLLQ